ncbi:hypothetical protein ACHAWF_017444 [Thalassiosira exigua]
MGIDTTMVGRVNGEHCGDGDSEGFVSAADEVADEPRFKTGVPLDITGERWDGIHEEDLTLPESTHSFLFTEPVYSIPFLFSLGIAAISYACLILALLNNLTTGHIPANVDLSVRIAQYLSILIALLMEEGTPPLNLAPSFQLSAAFSTIVFFSSPEIPTGLFLLRFLSKPYLKSKFPELSYSKFVCSSLLRITMGYLFLVNVVIILIQADGVITIFYDCLALQFIQKLDDIGFSISKMDVLGRNLQRATMTPYFQFQFQRGQGSLGHKWRARLLLKGAYFVNLAGFLTAMLVVSDRQRRGCYQCGAITVQFGDEVWKDSIVRIGKTPVAKWRMGDITEERVLVYSFFNGEYVKDLSRTHQGRPVYIEMKKSDRSPFDDTAPEYDPYHPDDRYLESVKPAEIKYCEGRWVFTHEYIRKSKKDKPDEYECDWLARSPETEGFDLLEIDGKWQVWTGVVVESDINIRCDECSGDDDCNLQGKCIDGKCDCDADDDAVHLGSYCEVKLEHNCRTIIEQYNDTWSVSAPIFTAVAWARMIGSADGSFFQEYSRPVYSYVSGLPEGQAPEEGDSLSLIYSGSRWMRINIKGSQDVNNSDFWVWQTTNYHAFWARAYLPGITTLISEPTENDSPVGVDFFYVGEHSNQFGPFGLLVPAQKHNMTGRGVYRCEEEPCSFCANGVAINEGFMIPEDFNASAIAAGYSCGMGRELLPLPRSKDDGIGVLSALGKWNGVMCPRDVSMCTVRRPLQKATGL